MKRWAFVTVLLYALCLLGLTAPVMLLGWAKFTGTGWDMKWGETLELYSAWGYWLWLAVLLAAQALLLVVPVRAAERRPRPRRHVWTMWLTASFLLANLASAGLMAVLAALAGDQMDKPFEWIGEAVWTATASVPIFGPLLETMGVDAAFLARASFFAPLGLCWLGWGWAFARFARVAEPEAVVQRAVRWLVRGSILELLVAVPCHVLVRSRNTCCAHAATFWGIATGLSVMLMAFGPGVFFLFAARCRRLRPAATEAAPPIIPVEGDPR
jgi:hypothetical protein